MKQHKYLAIPFGVVGVVLSLGIAAGAPPTITYTSIDYPDATSTIAWGINARGDIVGSYTDLANVRHGFLFSGGAFTQIDYPGAEVTEARGINPRGDIVGTHQGPNRSTPGSGGDIHGFLLRAGTTVPEPIDYPGHMNTIAQRITAAGQIIGCYHDHDTMASMYGMILSGGHYLAVDGSAGGLDVPASMHNGSTPDGSVITGLYTDMTTGKSRSYIINGGAFTPFDVPGSLATSAWDMNPSGEIVGVYRDAGLNFHGFLMTAGGFFSIDYPAEGVRATRAFGINPQGSIVGTYVDAAGVTHGFLLTQTRPPGQ